MLPPPSRSVVVAIDGPSGTGKSSVSRQVARRLGVRYLDTGAMYRALTWWCRQRGVDLADLDAVTSAAHELPLRMGMDPEAATVYVADHEVEPELRTSEISQVVSQVAGNLDARAELIRRQRQIIAESRARGLGVVAEGRDITTVVAPDADVRILLVADERTRLRRRARQLHGADTPELLAHTRDEVIRRDADDARVADFFEAAPGVTVIDSTDLDLDQTVERVLAAVFAAAPGTSSAGPA